MAGAGDTQSRAMTMATAGFQVVVTSNAVDAARWLDGLARKQIPFASAVALTRLAQVAQKLLKANLRRHFTIRNARVGQGIRIKRAEKTDWPRCQAFVGSVDNFMINQATGEPKRSRDGHHVAIPSRIAISARTGSGKMPAAVKPRALVHSSRGFIGLVEGGREAIFRRTGRQKGNLRNLGVTRYYLLATQQPMKKRWPIREEVSQAVGSNYEAVFARELRAAIRSARARAGSFTGEQGKATYLSALRKEGLRL